MTWLGLVWVQLVKVGVESKPYPTAYGSCFLSLIVTRHGSGRFVVMTESHYIGIVSIYACFGFYLLVISKLCYHYSY